MTTENIVKIIAFFNEWSLFLTNMGSNLSIDFNNFSLPIPLNAYEFIGMSLVLGGRKITIDNIEYSVPLYIAELGFKSENAELTMQNKIDIARSI